MEESTKFLSATLSWLYHYYQHVVPEIYKGISECREQVILSESQRILPNEIIEAGCNPQFWHDEFLNIKLESFVDFLNLVYEQNGIPEDHIITLFIKFVLFQNKYDKVLENIQWYVWNPIIEEVRAFYNDSTTFYLAVDGNTILMDFIIAILQNAGVNIDDITELYIHTPHIHKPTYTIVDASLFANTGVTNSLMDKLNRGIYDPLEPDEIWIEFLKNYPDLQYFYKKWVRKYSKKVGIRIYTLKNDIVNACVYNVCYDGSREPQELEPFEIVRALQCVSYEKKEIPLQNYSTFHYCDGEEELEYTSFPENFQRYNKIQFRLIDGCIGIFCVEGVSVTESYFASYEMRKELQLLVKEYEFE